MKVAILTGHEAALPEVILEIRLHDYRQLEHGFLNRLLCSYLACNFYDINMFRLDELHVRIKYINRHISNKYVMLVDPLEITPL